MPERSRDRINQGKRDLASAGNKQRAVVLFVTMFIAMFILSCKQAQIYYNNDDT